MLSIQKLKDLVHNKKIHTVTLAFPDIYGRLMGKRFDADYFVKDTLKNGGHACNYLLACNLNMDPIEGLKASNWAAGYGDYHMVPDLNTARLMAWFDGHAVMFSDLHDEAEQPVPFAPRNILKNYVQKAKDMGYLVNCASELEYFAFEGTSKQNFDDGYKNLRPTGIHVEDYHLLQGDKHEPFVGKVRSMLKECGMVVETSKGEAARGQHEINLQYNEPMKMADDHMLFKQCTKAVAESMGISVTFMPKPFRNQSGSGCHIHFSLTDMKGKNVFNGKDIELDKTRHIWASKEMMYFLGGWIKHTQDLFPFYAPTINSYKRFEKASWAPTNLKAWSIDNRTAPFRIVGHGESLRIEFRIGGADLNPYLGFSAALASGLDGIKNKIEPPPMFKGNVYEQQGEDRKAAPRSLDKALHIFGKSEFAAQMLGEDVRDHLKGVLYSEVDEFHKVVTDYEYKRYFDQI
jgi:glutamine synthetase